MGWAYSPGPLPNWDSTLLLMRDFPALFKSEWGSILVMYTLLLLLFLFLFFWKKWKVKVIFAQSCLTLCDPMDCSLWPWNSPGKNTGEGSYSLLQGIFLTQGSNPVFCIAGRFLTFWATSPCKACLSIVYLAQMDVNKSLEEDKGKAWSGRNWMWERGRITFVLHTKFILSRKPPVCNTSTFARLTDRLRPALWSKCYCP